MLCNLVKIILGFVRAVFLIVCMAHVKPRSSTRSQHQQVWAYYNLTGFRCELNDVVTPFWILPYTRGGIHLVYLCLKCSLLNPIVFYLSQAINAVELCQDLWYDQPERKPPYSKTTRETRRKMLKHPLLYALLLMSETPEIVQAGDRACLQELSFQGYKVLGKLSTKQAAAVQNIIRSLPNGEFLESINAITGVVDSGVSNFPRATGMTLSKRVTLLAMAVL